MDILVCALAWILVVLAMLSAGSLGLACLVARRFNEEGEGPL